MMMSKMRFFLLLCLFALTSVLLSAQADVTYRLRVPDAEEYLAAILELPALSESERQIIEVALTTQYEDEIVHVDYVLVDKAHKFFMRDYPQIDTEAFWLQACVAAWLNSQQIDLDMTTEFEFDDMLIPVTSLDLNNDGQNEWVLDFQQNEFQSYVVIHRDENGAYRVVSTPLPFELYQELMFASEGVTKAEWNIEYFGDVTGDGQPELAVRYTFQNDDYENMSLDGRYFILSWSDGSLVDIGGEGLSFRLQSLQTTWEWIHVDDSPALQLRQIREMRDNWDCFWEQTTIFSWDGSAFTEAQIEEDYPETARCYLRLAENALRTKDYDGAIMNYRQVERLDSASDMNRVGDYGTIRLALALILNDQEAQGIEMLHSLQNKTDGFGRLPELISMLLDAYDENPTPVGVCLAAYNFFWLNSYYVWEEGFMEVGRTVDNLLYGSGMYIPPPASPTGAGCDAPEMIEDLLLEHTFTTQSTPVEQLQALGIPWESVFYDDLNGDGLDDWILGISAIHIPPVFFLSNGTAYSVSRHAPSPPREPDEFNQLFAFQLPEDAGIALLRTNYVQPYVQSHLGYGSGGGPGECPASGSVSIWRLDQNTLIPILSSLLCEKLETQGVVDDLAVVSHVYGWEFSDQVYDYVPMEYVWNSMNRRYELKPEAALNLTPLPVQELETPAIQTYSLAPLLLQREYERIINNYQEAVTGLRDTNIADSFQWGYVAALSFEALNRPDEALTEYVGIYEAAPDSAWGMLAALHLEVDETE